MISGTFKVKGKPETLKSLQTSWKVGVKSRLLKIQTMLCKEEEQIGTTADFQIYVYSSFNVHN